MKGNKTRANKTKKETKKQEQQEKEPIQQQQNKEDFLSAIYSLTENSHKNEFNTYELQPAYYIPYPIVQIITSSEVMKKSQNDQQDQNQLNQQKNMQVEKVQPKAIKHHKCEKCQQIFSTKFKLDNHMKKECNDENKICKFCLKVCASKKMKQIHELEHQDKNPKESFSFQCQICFQTFNDNDLFQRHQVIHPDNNELLKTEQQQQYFPTKRRLEKIDQNDTKNDQNDKQGAKSNYKLYKCNKCTKEFNMIYLLQHEKMHLKEAQEQIAKELNDLRIQSKKKRKSSKSDTNSNSNSICTKENMQDFENKQLQDGFQSNEDKESHHSITTNNSYQNDSVKEIYLPNNHIENGEIEQRRKINGKIELVRSILEPIQKQRQETEVEIISIKQKSQNLKNHSIDQEAIQKKCEECDLTFNNSKAYDMHIFAHNFALKNKQDILEDQLFTTKLQEEWNEHQKSQQSQIKGQFVYKQQMISLTVQFIVFIIIMSFLKVIVQRLISTENIAFYFYGVNSLQILLSQQKNTINKLSICYCFHQEKALQSSKLKIKAE